jgi:secreted trypsin-like serine protease
MIKYILFISLFLFSNCLGGTIRPDTSDEKYIEYGKKFHCIGRICGKYKSGDNYCASAVAIKPNWVLTAAHVVKDSETCFVTIEDKKIEIKKVIWHKDFEEKEFGLADIALGYSEDTSDLDFYPNLYSDEGEVGKVCSMAGYGLTGTFNTGIHFSDNKRRAGSNVIDKVDRDLLICTPSKNNERMTELEFLIGSGDSGGGLFLDGKLAGINSCVLAIDKKPNSTYSDESGHTRVSKYIDWINSTIEEFKY